VKGYCFPDEGCYSELQRCDGYWHCPGGRDEEDCPLCQPGDGACYSASERCNNQKKKTALTASLEIFTVEPTCASLRRGAAMGRKTVSMAVMKETVLHPGSDWQLGLWAATGHCTG
ncbi:hypothetical protein M9458_015958, partial [Cirrhinus mrigala]